MEFKEFPKMARWSRDVIVTEKIDGTNASVYIGEDGTFLVGSRTRWITPEDDNYGFAAWAYERRGELIALGVGHHFGEWWGRGIQRNYSQPERHFSLFNVSRWGDADARPACCSVVPVLYQGPLEEFGVTKGVKDALKRLESLGSVAAPGFMDPEGIVIFHVAANIGFKKALGTDGHKGAEAEAKRAKWLEKQQQSAPA